MEKVCANGFLEEKNCACAFEKQMKSKTTNAVCFMVEWFVQIYRICGKGIGKANEIISRRL
jgi:hypothetical protein